MNCAHDSLPEKKYSSLANVLSALPEQPGIYQFFDRHGKIIYIGKAKNLKKRVSSYFAKKHAYGKLFYLVTSIVDIKYMVVDTEADALLLENNLIKKYQPRYNVALKDDKTYPWICIRNERFPRIFPTRKLIRDGSQYFGPYTSLRMMHTMLDLIKKLYPLRNCSLNLSEENIVKKKIRVCLEYHLKNCKGPCEALQTEKDYNENIAEIEQLLKGNTASLLKQLKETMWKHAETYEFEKANQLKEKIALLEKYRSRSVIVSPAIENADVFSFSEDEKCSYVNMLKVMHGAVVQGHTLEMKKKLNETREELLQLAVTELRQRFNSDAKEIIVPFFPGTEIPGIEIIIPQKGDKKKLLALSFRNLEYYLLEKQRKAQMAIPARHEERMMETLMRDLRLKEKPLHIECFDNSNTQGTHPTAACVVFKNAKPVPKEYRHFNIKTVSGPDDFASMEEVVFRRYKRMLEEKKPLPQLIVIDGGKGQLGAAVKSLKKLNLHGKIAVIGIAKKLDEIFYPGDSLPLYLNKKSETLKIIQRLRNEAHRFGLKHHRRKREKYSVVSELTAIRGISEKTAGKLLQKFKSVKRIKKTQEEKLAEAVGKAKAKKIWEHFSKENQSSGI